MIVSSTGTSQFDAWEPTILREPKRRLLLAGGPAVSSARDPPIQRVQSEKRRGGAATRGLLDGVHIAKTGAVLPTSSHVGSAKATISTTLPIPRTSCHVLHPVMGAVVRVHVAGVKCNDDSISPHNHAVAMRRQITRQPIMQPRHAMPIWDNQPPQKNSPNWPKKVLTKTYTSVY